MTDSEKPSDQDLNKLIDELKIDVKRMKISKAKLREAAKQQEDPVAYLRDVAAGQADRDDDKETDTTNEAENSDKADHAENSQPTDQDGDEPTEPESDHVQDGDELAKQGQTHFCPACSDEKANKFVSLRALSSPRTNNTGFTWYGCPVKGCGFRKKVIRHTVAKAFKEYKRLSKPPRVNPRE